MEYLCIGISHQTAALAEREKVNCTPLQRDAALQQYAAQKEQYLGADSEIAILSTCNRFEIYAARREESLSQVEGEAAYRILLEFMSAITRVSASAGDTRFYRYQGMEAVGHLLRVSAGLDSQVLGEAQILGQVAEALQAAQQAGAARHTLSTLFRAAIHCGKRAHAETAIGENPASISSVAVRVIEEMVGKVQQQAVLVIGAGEMANLAVKALRLRGAEKVTIVNRTYGNALTLAARYGVKAWPFETLRESLQAADIVISCTGSATPILNVGLVGQVMERRQERGLLLLDIALPRDIAPEVRGLAGVQLFDLDDMKHRLKATFEHRQKEASQVERIVREEMQAFAHWMEVIPTVGKLHRKAEKIRQQEVERVMQHLSDVDPAVQEQIERLSRSLVKKLLHEPSTKLRTEVKNRQLGTYMDTLHYLFGLNEEDYDGNGANRHETIH